MNRLMKSTASILLAMSALVLLGCDDESDIIGLDEATKYGYIKVTLEGTDPNGDDYTVTKNFKFAPSGTPMNSSAVYTYDDDGFYQRFDVTRYLGPFNNANGDDNYADLYLVHRNETPDFDDAELYIETVITTANKQYFNFSRDIYFNSEDVTSYSYNPDSGKLSLKFTTEVETYLGMVTVTANINVTVFENLTPFLD